VKPGPCELRLRPFHLNATMSQRTTVPAATATVLYMLANILMNLFMKWFFSPQGGNFSLPWTMLTFQQLQAFLCLQAWTRCTEEDWGWSSIRGADIQTVDFLQLLAVTGLFCCNAGLNSLSLVRMSITLNQTIRAFLPLGVLLFANCLEGRPYPKWSYITSAMLITGIVLSCLHSPEFEMYSFSLAFGSTLIAALGCSLNGRVLHMGAFSSQGRNQVVRLLMLQSVPAAAIFAIVAIFVEGERLQSLVSNSSSWRCCEWLALLAISGALALATNLFRCLLVAATSALTETFAGNVKVAALCVIDNRLFGTVLGTINYAGVFVTFLGFSVHSVLQYTTASPAVSAASQLVCSSEQEDEQQAGGGEYTPSVLLEVAPAIASVDRHGLRLHRYGFRNSALPETGLAAESWASQLKVARKQTNPAKLNESLRPSRHSWHAGSSQAELSQSPPDLPIESTYSALLRNPSSAMLFIERTSRTEDLDMEENFRSALPGHCEVPDSQDTTAQPSFLNLLALWSSQGVDLEKDREEHEQILKTSRSELDERWVK